MLQKEKYIKKIIARISFYLNTVQTEAKLTNAVGLYDIDILLEDFFCELLNLLYGYELKNKNNEEKNATAIDLYDRKQKIAVQVTADNTRHKVNETIDKFLNEKLYEEYNRLIFVFLKDKPNLIKPFDTKGRFPFDLKTDILDIKDLMERLKALETPPAKNRRFFDFIHFLPLSGCTGIAVPHPGAGGSRAGRTQSYKSL